MNIAYEVIVYGATPGGIGAAIGAARRGRRSLLLEPSRYIGGMMTSGLGRTDIGNLDASGAIYREFAQRVLDYYKERYGEDSKQVQECRRGVFFEPSLARSILKEMIQREPLITVQLEQELSSAAVADNRIHAITVLSRTTGEEQTWSGDVFIDGTYEGDLAAKAGVPYWTGRESRDEWNEEYAGKLYMNFDQSKEVFPGSTGEGDSRVQAYNYRLCLTDVPENRVAVSKPERYRREEYISLIGDIEAGRVSSIKQVLNILPIPNGKTDANNHHYCMCSSDLPEENTDYLEGDSDVRERVRTRHKQHLQGLLWFVQHDEAVPAAFRQDALRWGYAADEFTDTDHFPPQLYVREGRRIQGEYVFTENDARIAPGLQRTLVHYDSIAVGAYGIDSHATRKREPAGKNLALEGFLGLGWITGVYQVPYSVMVPKRVEGLLVPVAVSATHMGIGTIRMEPCWMQLGYAAGVAADMSINRRIYPRHISIDQLQDELLSQNQLITFFQDIQPLTEEGKAIQYFGTKGVFPEYVSHGGDAITVGQASRIIMLCRGLPGGRSFPALPASAAILPAGVDMGPRLPRTEPSPEEYWAGHPQLTRTMFVRWQQAVSRALVIPAGVAANKSDAEVTIGEFCGFAYRMLKENRKRKA